VNQGLDIVAFRKEFKKYPETELSIIVKTRMEYLEQRENNENEQKRTNQDNRCKQERFLKQFPDIEGILFR
jgi:hypothetical protein